MKIEKGKLGSVFYGGHLIGGEEIVEGALFESRNMADRDDRVGVFPESLRRGHQQQQLEHYRDCGKRAYLVASRIQSDDVPGELLARLGNDFDTCVSGLHQIRSHWKAPPESPQH